MFDCIIAVKKDLRSSSRMEWTPWPTEWKNIFSLSKPVSEVIIAEQFLSSPSSLVPLVPPKRVARRKRRSHNVKRMILVAHAIVTLSGPFVKGGKGKGGETE